MVLMGCNTSYGYVNTLQCLVLVMLRVMLLALIGSRGLR
jgi:hypothetical protein